jgi:peptide/nickel transport system permease protein
VARLDLGASLTVAPGAAVGPLVLGAAGRSARLLFPAALLARAAGYAGAALAGAGASAPAPAWRGWLVRGAAGLAALPAVFASLAVVNGVNAAAWALLEADRVPRPEWFALPTVDHPVRTALAVVVLAGSSASLTWMLRRAGDTLRELGDRPFVTAERARGGPLLPLFARHLVVPAARLAAAQVPALLSALVVVERAFAMPGAGSLFWESCGERDWPLALGLALLAACTATAARFVADVVAVVVDPREREALA